MFFSCFRDDATHCTLFVVLVEVHFAKVTFDAGFLCEEFTAEFTVKWFLSVMDTHVTGQVSGLCESLTTLIASETSTRRKVNKTSTKTYMPTIDKS